MNSSAASAALRTSVPDTLSLLESCAPGRMSSPRTRTRSFRSPAEPGNDRKSFKTEYDAETGRLSMKSSNISFSYAARRGDVFSPTCLLCSFILFECMCNHQCCFPFNTLSRLKTNRERVLNRQIKICHPSKPRTAQSSEEFPHAKIFRRIKKPSRTGVKIQYGTVFNY